MATDPWGRDIDSHYKEGRGGLGGTLGRTIDKVGGGGKYKPDESRYGVPGYDERQGYYRGIGEGYGNFQTPQLDPSVYGFAKGRMKSGDTFARALLDRNVDRAQSAAQARAATGRGNPALAARLGSQEASRATAGLGSQAALADIQERGMWGQLAGGMAGQNLAAALQAQGLRQQGQLGAGQLELGQAQSQQMGMMSLEGLKAAIAAQPGLLEKILSGGADAYKAKMLQGKNT